MSVSFDYLVLYIFQSVNRTVIIRKKKKMSEGSKFILMKRLDKRCPFYFDSCVIERS